MHPANSILLGINVDHVATLRQARGTRYPDPVDAALLAERNGADSITVHLREDRRHIQERDVRVMSELLQTRVNLEMAVTDEMIAFASALQPADCCLVPERRQELTTEGGLDVITHHDRVRDAILQLNDAGIFVSLFIDPDEKQIAASKQLGAQAVELHTGSYANADSPSDRTQQLDLLRSASRLVVEHGLHLHAGHGLTYSNVVPIAQIPEMEELNIGHSIVARSIFVGFQQAVREMKVLCS